MKWKVVLIFVILQYSLITIKCEDGSDIAENNLSDEESDASESTNLNAALEAAKLLKLSINADPVIQLAALRKANELLSENQHSTFDEFIPCLPFFVELLSSDNFDLKHEAVSAVSSISSSSSYHIHSIVVAGAVPPLLKLLESNDTTILSNAVYCLEQIIKNEEYHRDIYIKYNIIPKLINLTKNASAALLNTTLSIMNHLLIDQPTTDKTVKEILPICAKYIQHPENYVARTSIHCIETISLNVEEHRTLIINYKHLLKNLIKLLRRSDDEIDRMALSVLVAVTYHDKESIPVLLDYGVLRYLKIQLMSKNNEIKENSLLLLQNILCDTENEKDNIMIITRFGRIFIKMLNNNTSEVQLAAAAVVSNAAFYESQKMIDMGVIIRLSKLLNEMYYNEDESNENIVNVLTAFKNVLENGGSEIENIRNQLQNIDGNHGITIVHRFTEEIYSQGIRELAKEILQLLGFAEETQDDNNEIN